MTKDQGEQLFKQLFLMITETNGLSLMSTIDLLLKSHRLVDDENMYRSISAFKKLIYKYHEGQEEVEELLRHPFSEALTKFFVSFPISFKEEHIHLTGSLLPKFLFPYISELLDGPHKSTYEKKIRDVYGDAFKNIDSEEDLSKLLKLTVDERFDRYLEKLFLPKLVLTSREIHEKASYNMAKDLYERYNVGSIRLKFTYSRATTNKKEEIPGTEALSSSNVVMGLYDGFRAYQKENPVFNFILSPCFRKELSFYDAKNFSSKADHFEHQVDGILDLLKLNPGLSDVLSDVDTVGDERDLYKKEHFFHMRMGFRRLAARGIRVRSHHGENFLTLNKGIQSVDNAMNIWRIDSLEHGLALGINPNEYFQSLTEDVLCLNSKNQPVPEGPLLRELREWTFSDPDIMARLMGGMRLNAKQSKEFIKSKFYYATEVEHYQHDVLNRLIDKKVTLTALPSSNQKLTGVIPGYKDHPFSWWEKKGISLGIGTDNYVTLDTNYIKELLLLLFSEPSDLKIMKLLMVASGETRRLHISHLLWETKKTLFG